MRFNLDNVIRYTLEKLNIKQKSDPDLQQLLLMRLVLMCDEKIKNPNDCEANR